MNSAPVSEAQGFPIFKDVIYDSYSMGETVSENGAFGSSLADWSWFNERPSVPTFLDESERSIGNPPPSTPVLYQEEGTHVDTLCTVSPAERSVVGMLGNPPNPPPGFFENQPWKEIPRPFTLPSYNQNVSEFPMPAACPQGVTALADAFKYVPRNGSVVSPELQISFHVHNWAVDQTPPLPMPPVFNYDPHFSVPLATPSTTYPVNPSAQPYNLPTTASFESYSANHSPSSESPTPSNNHLSRYCSSSSGESSATRCCCTDWERHRRIQKHLRLINEHCALVNAEFASMFSAFHSASPDY